MEKYRIAIAGIGGVGGYYGGKLARRFAADAAYEVIFIARGPHKAAIAQQGLKLELDSETLAANPSTVAESGEALGKLDLILFCVKSYSLEEVAEQLTASIGPDTVLLPLLNGIEGIEYLQRRFPQAQVLWGCVYIISSVKAPGVVRVQGKYNRLVWGNPRLPKQTRQHLQGLFEAAGINQEPYGQEIKERVWEKFSFISPVGSLTSLTNKPMGQLLQQPALKQQLAQLMQELTQVAQAKGVALPPDLVERNLAVVGKLPQGATSSMQRDFAVGKLTELETLTGYIVREAERLQVAAPQYRQVYEALKSRRSLLQ